jgi:hypothetical protein
VSKIVAFAVGGLFIAVQSLSYAGFVKVDYDGIQKKVEVSLTITTLKLFPSTVFLIECLGFEQRWKIG